MSEIDFEKSQHPFAELLGFTVKECAEGKSVSVLPYHVKLFNSNRVMHGGAVYSLADTGMGAALFSLLEKGERCATIEIKVTYLRPCGPHDLLCNSVVLKKGRRVAMIESEIFSNDELVAKATGSFAMFTL